VSKSLTDTITTDNEVVLTWRIHLAKEQPQQLAGILVAMAGMGMLAYVLFQNLIPAIVMAFVFLGSLSDFLLPVTYTLTKKEASASTLVGKQVIAWEKVRKCYLHEDGIKLSPLGRKSRLEAYRGVFLRFNGNQEELIEAVRKLRPQNA